MHFSGNASGPYSDGRVFGVGRDLTKPQSGILVMGFLKAPGGRHQPDRKQNYAGLTAETAQEEVLRKPTIVLHNAAAPPRHYFVSKRTSSGHRVKPAHYVHP